MVVVHGLEPEPITSKIEITVTWKKEQIDAAELARLRWVEKLGYKRIAARLGVSRSGVIHRLRKMEALKGTEE